MVETYRSSRHGISGRWQAQSVINNQQLHHVEHQKHDYISLQSMFIILKRDKATLELYWKCLPRNANIGHRHTKLQTTSSMNGEQTL